MKKDYNNRILIIDDNPVIHEDFIKILSPEIASNEDLEKLKGELFGETSKKFKMPTFEIHTAIQGEEGYSKVQLALKEQRPFALAFIDMRMPSGWDGLMTTRKIWEIDPNIQVVICAAFSDYSWEETIKHLGQTNRLLILKKPFDNIEVCQLACSLTEKWNLNQHVQEHMIKLQEMVNERTAELKATLEATNDGILVLNRNGNIADYNKKFLTLWNFAEHDIKSANSKSIFNKISERLSNLKLLSKKLEQYADDAEELSSDELILSDGRIFECFSQPQKLDNETIGRVWSFRDITYSKMLQEQLSFQATHDTLTGLPNRNLLIDRITQAIIQANRQNEYNAVLFIDIDKFKDINDIHGHDVGDKLLQETVKRIKGIIRECDTLARLGGDEFILMLSGLKKPEDAVVIAQKLIKEFNSPYIIDNCQLRVTTSIGISISPNDGDTAETLIKNADIAMYRAKESGRNNFKFYTFELNNAIKKRINLAEHLELAFKRDEFILHYQPIVDLATYKIIGVEALLRWQHPVLGLVPPSEFIPFAEESDMINRIGEWVLYHACKQNKAWMDQGMQFLRMAINISGNQIKQKKFNMLISDVLYETKLDPQYLELEITERAIMENAEHIMANTFLWKDLGIKLSVDDFGTGYSNLNYLMRLPISKIKIDHSFIHYISPSAEDTAIIKTIIAMARSLNLRVLAEGVENEAQKEFLVNHQCDEAQGFYFSRPLTKDAFTEFLLKFTPESITSK